MNGVIEQLRNAGVIPTLPIVYGTNGNDTLQVRHLAQDGIVVGGDGADNISGGTGNDLLKGSAGDDTIRGRAGNDYIDGCEGTDTAIFDDSGLRTIELMSGGAPPADRGMAPDIDAPFFTVKRANETDILHSIENIRLSDKGDTLKVAQGTDLTGLEEIDATNQPFDPNLHEAVSHQESAAVPEGQVLQQLRKGYKLRDRLIRPASVVVARKPAA